MSLCDKCIHRDVCSDEDLGEGVVKVCLDFIDKSALSVPEREKGEYIKKEDALKMIEQNRDQICIYRAVEALQSYSFPEREKGTDGTLVYNADGHFYGVMGGDAIMDRIRGKAE